jgi:hypothetical protein
MKLTTHNTEQATRGYVTYELARRGYLVQSTDSRFPREDLLIVSPNRKHFGIDVKGQRTKNFWQIKKPELSDQLFYFLVYMPKDELPDIYIIDSPTLLTLWEDYRNRILKNGGKEDGRWGVNWTTPFEFKDNWEILPK